MNKKGLTVIVPCYNEEESISKFFSNLIAFCEERGWNIIAVNDGSKDKTKELLENISDYNKFRVISHKVNKGYGGAVKSGIENTITEYCITIDGDGQHFIDDLETLHTSIVKNDGDMVIGSRRANKSASKFRSFGKWIIRSFAKIFMKLDIYDINTGMRIFRTDLGKKYLHLLPDSFPFCDIISLLFVYNRHLVYEVPIKVRKRMGGKSIISINTAFETIMEILNIVVLFNPMKLFLPLSLLFFIFGVIWGLYQFSLGHGVSVGSSLLITMGVLIFLLGLIAEQLTKIRNHIK